jgi:hypothetical protein
MTKTGFRLLPYLKAKNGSSETNDFNDLENRESRDIPLPDTASRKRVGEALKFLDRNLHGLRRGTAKHDHLIGRERASRRPLSTAKAIRRDYLKVDQRGPTCDPSDIQELWVRVFKRQGRIIYPEQERDLSQARAECHSGQPGSRRSRSRRQGPPHVQGARHAGSQLGQG